MRFVSDLKGPESPFALPDGSWLLVEMGAERGCVTCVARDGRSTEIIARTGRPNAVVVDRAGVLWVAESGAERALLRVTMDGTVDVFSLGCEGEPFLFPNDLCFGPDGSLYMTDSGILFDDWAPGGELRADFAEARIDGRVYRIDIDDGLVMKIDQDLRFPNGIAFGTDGHLYVNEMITGDVYRYTLAADGFAAERERFGNVLDPASSEGFGPMRFRGPDGQAFGADGSLYVTVFGQRHVAVLDPDGQVRRRIPTGGLLPTNVAFGPAGEKRIYVTEAERGCVEMFDAETPGAPLHG